MLPEWSAPDRCGSAIPGSADRSVRATGSSSDEPYSLIYATLISAIGSAETSVYVANAYFVPDPHLHAALNDAAQRGVDVKLILGQEFGAQMQTMFDADLAESDPITLENWNKRSLDNRVKEIAARVWEYWL